MTEQIARHLYASLLAAEIINDCGPYDGLGDFMREALEAVADQVMRAHLAAIEASDRAVVSLEPTIEMCDAATRSTSAFMALEQRGADLRRLKHAIRWRAMLASRPRA